jgi:hypothetical protein
MDEQSDLNLNRSVPQNKENSTAQEYGQMVDVGGVKDLPLLTRIRLNIGGYDPKRKKVFKVIIGLFILMIVLLILSSVATMLRSRRKLKPAPKPTPAIMPTEAPSELPSRYASDSAVVKLDKDVEDLDHDLSQTNLHDSDLRVPDIYFDKKFY